MIKNLVIRKSVLIGFLLALAVIMLTASEGFAQTTDDPEGAAKKYGVSFPVSDLGGCKDFSECRSFCEDPVNSTACVSFAKSKGFYKEDPVTSQKEKVLEQAKKNLGCNSYESCLNFCEVPGNYDKCHSFAQNEGISGGIVADPSRVPVLEKAKQVLGCNSEQGCKSFCEQEANVQKCSEFAKQTGLRGGEHRVGPGGCTSEATCKGFCSNPENFQVCSGFSSTTGGNFSGPGGCNSEASCRSYCQENESECGRGGPGGPGGQGGQPRYNPAEMCNRTPNCSWSNSGCQCGFYGETRESQNKASEYANICQANPEKCKVGPGGYPIPEEKLRNFTGSEGTETNFQDYGDYCKKSPERCKPGGFSGRDNRLDDPAASCSRYGCSWTGNSCQCSGITDRVNYPGGNNGGPGSSSCKEPPSGCPAGWSWNSGACSCNPNPGTSVPKEGSQGSGNPNGGSSDSYWSGGQPGGPGAPYPGRSSSGGGAYGGGYDASGKYVGGSYGGYDSSGSYVGTGSQSGSEGSYSGGGSYSGNYTPPSGGSYTPPSGGSYNYTPPSGGGTPTPATAPQPAPATAPAPAPAAPAPAPAAPPPSEPAPAAPAPAVQGESTLSPWQIFLNFIRGK